MLMAGMTMMGVDNGDDDNIGYDDIKVNDDIDDGNEDDQFFLLGGGSGRLVGLLVGLPLV